MSRSTNTRRTVCVAVLLIALSALSARPAMAQTAADAARAEQLFAEATTLAAAGKYDEACPKFAESQRLDSALGTQFNLALCLEKLGSLGSAWRNFRAAERLAHQTMKVGRETAAREKLEQLRPRVSHLVLTAQDADVTLKVDGELAPADTWSFYVVDDGEHVVEASAPAKESWRARITISRVAGGPGAGDRGVERLVAVPPLVRAAGRTVTVRQETANTKRTVGFVLGGVGIVAVGTAVVTGVALLNDRSIADDRCTPKCSDEAARNAVATGKTLIPINVVAWAVGLVGLGVGSVLVLTSSSKTSVTAELAPLVGAGTAGASAVGRF